MPIKAALPQEPSSGEEDEATTSPQTTSSFDDSSRKVGNHLSGIASSSVTTTNGNSFATKATKELDMSDASIRDAILEAQIEEKRVAKRAEDKVKDHLAQVAREKLGMITKEKQLQLERKKRAMAFLTQIKSGDAPAAPSTTSTDDLETSQNINQTIVIVDEIGSSVSTANSEITEQRIIISNGGTIEDDDDDDDDDVQLVSEKIASRSR